MRISYLSLAIVGLLGWTTPLVNASIANDRAYEKAGNSFAPFFELGNRPEYLCVGGGGIWIGGRWALSAAHIYDNSFIKKPYRIPVNGVAHRELVQGKTVGIATYTSDEHIPIENVYLPIKLMEQDSLAFDICLVRLAYEPRTPGLKPARLSSVTDLLGKRVVVSGYGELGLGSTGKDGNRFKRSHPGMRFGFENILDTYTNLDAVVRFTFDKDGLPLEGAGSNGDSGCGMFIENKGQWELAGVFAHSSKSGIQHPRGANKSVYGSSDGGIRVALFLPEIQTALQSDDPSAFIALDTKTMEERIKKITPYRTLKEKEQALKANPSPRTESPDNP